MTDLREKQNAAVGDRYIFTNNALGIEEECIVTDVHPLSMNLITACGIMLKAVKGYNEQQFIPIRQVAG